MIIPLDSGIGGVERAEERQQRPEPRDIQGADETIREDDEAEVPASQQTQPQGEGEDAGEERETAQEKVPRDPEE